MDSGAGGAARQGGSHRRAGQRRKAAGARAALVCAALTAGVPAARADRDHGSAARHAHSISAPSLRSRSLVPGLERERPSRESELIEELRRLESQRPLRRGTTAIYVVDVATGRPIYAVHEDEPLNPASNVKLISTATALSVLGPDWRYATRVLGPSPGPDGVVAGDLYLIGSYDPTLRAANIGELAAALAGAGVTRVHGDVVVGPDAMRDSLSPALVQVQVHAGEVGAAPSVRLVADAGLLSDATRAEFLAHGFELDVRAETQRRRGRLEVQVSLAEATPPRYRVEVTGSIGKDRRAHIERRLPEPQIYTAQLLRAALIEAGIEVQGAVRVAELPAYIEDEARAGGLPIELARHESAPLATLVARINKRSLNRLADRVIMTAGAVLYGGPPSMDKAVRAMHGWLREHAGLDPDHVVIDTGSGLSYNTELTARQIVRVLRVAGGLLPPDPPAGAPDEASAAAADPAPMPALTAMIDASSPARAADASEPIVEITRQDASDAQPAQEEEAELAAEAEDHAYGRSGAMDIDVTSGQAAGALVTGQTGAGAQAEAFLRSLAVGGMDGTLRHRFRGLRGRILGKTGTLSQVVALSGLVSHGKDKLAFAIVTNGTDWRQRQRVRRQHEQIVAALYRYLRDRASRGE